VTGRAARVREAAASTAQYLLLGGFAAVAAGISAQGLTGFARTNMGLRGPWPYLLFFALDGAAAVCAVLLMRRAARGESGLAPRLAVWGLVAASAAFNASHAPRRTAAPEAYALMPVIAACLFEFCLRESRTRAAGKAGRALAALSWLHPAERIRITLMLASCPGTVAEATARVRTETAARRLHRLRLLLAAGPDAKAPTPSLARRIRRAEHRAHTAMTRAGFAADPRVAEQVLRQVQVLTITTDLARLDYTSPGPARAALASLLTAPPPAQPAGTRPAPQAPVPGPPRAPALNGRAALPPPASTDAAPAPASPPAPGRTRTAARPSPPAGDTGRDDRLVAAATRILEQAAADGIRLSQTALADKLRGEGHSISNGRLRWLAGACGLDQRHG
jgi:hypothetical protein